MANEVLEHVNNDALEIIEIAPKKRYMKTPEGKKQVESILGNFKSNSEYKWVPLDQLQIDHSYQRRFDDKRISRMAHNWDQDLCGPIIVNQRDNGTLYVIDGQQRVGAMLLIDNRPEKVLAQVFNGLSIEQEANLFMELDTKRQGLTTGAIFSSLIIARDPSALEIESVAHANGLTIDDKRGAAPNNLRAFGAIMGIHRRSGRATLNTIFHTVSQSWPNNQYWGTGSILKGLEIFLQKYPNANERHLIESLQRSTPREIENKARVLSEALSSAIAPWVGRVIHSQYNLGMKKNRLPDWE